MNPDEKQYLINHGFIDAATGQLTGKTFVARALAFASLYSGNLRDAISANAADPAHNAEAALSASYPEDFQPNAAVYLGAMQFDQVFVKHLMPWSTLTRDAVLATSGVIETEDDDYIKVGCLLGMRTAIGMLGQIH